MSGDAAETELERLRRVAAAVEEYCLDALSAYPVDVGRDRFARDVIDLLESRP